MSFQSGESPISRALRNAGQIIGGYFQQERQRRLQEELQRGQLSQERAMQLGQQLREQLAAQYALPPGQRDRRTIANLERELKQLGGVLDVGAREAAPVFQSATAGFDASTRGRRTTADRDMPVRGRDVEAGTGRVAESTDVTLPGLEGRVREQPTQAVIGQAAGQAAAGQRFLESQKAEEEALQSQVGRIQSEVIPDQIERLEESITPDLNREERQQVQARIGALEDMLVEQPGSAQEAQGFITRVRQLGSPTALATEARTTGAGRAAAGEAATENAGALLETANTYQDQILDLSGEVEDDELSAALRQRATALGQLPRTVATEEGATEFMNQWNALEGERPTAALLVEAQQQAARDATASERDQGTLDIMQDFATREGLTAEEKLNQIAAAASAMPEGFLERNRERVAQIEGLANLEDPQALRQRTLEQRQQQLQNRLSKLDVEEAERTLDEVVEQEKLQTIRDRIDTEIASGTRDAEIRTAVAEMLSAEAGAEVDQATIDALITQRRLDATETKLDVDFKRDTYENRVTKVGQDVAEGKISIEDGLAELYRDEVRFKQNTQLKDAELTRANQAIRDANIELEREQENEVRNRIISAAETGFTGDLNDEEMAALAHYLGHEPGSQEFTAEINEIRQSNLDAIEASKEREELLNDELIQSIGISEDRARREAERFEWERYEHNQTLSENAIENVTDFESELLNAVQGGNPGLFDNMLMALENPDAYPQLNRALKERGFGGRRGKNRLKTLRGRAEERRSRAREDAQLRMDLLRSQVRQGVGAARQQQVQTAESIASVFDTVEDFQNGVDNLPSALRAALDSEEGGLRSLVEMRIARRNAVESEDQSLEALSMMTNARPENISAWKENFVDTATDAGFTQEWAEGMADSWGAVWQREGDDRAREIEKHRLDMNLARRRMDKLNLDIEDLQNPTTEDATDLRLYLSTLQTNLRGQQSNLIARRRAGQCDPIGTWNDIGLRGASESVEDLPSPLSQDECNALGTELEVVGETLRETGNMLGESVGVPLGEIRSRVGGGGTTAASQGEGNRIPSEREGQTREPIQVRSVTVSPDVQNQILNFREQGNTRGSIARALQNDISAIPDLNTALDIVDAVLGDE